MDTHLGVSEHTLKVCESDNNLLGALVKAKWGRGKIIEKGTAGTIINE